MTEPDKSFVKYPAGALDMKEPYIGPPVRSDKSITVDTNPTNNDVNTTKPNVKSMNSSENFQTAISNFGIKTQAHKSSKLSDFRGFQVLKSLKMSLEGTLNCVNFIKLGVHENILAKASAKHNFDSLSEKRTQHCTKEANVIDLKSEDIPKDNSFSQIDDASNDLNMNSMESEQTKADKVNCNSNEINNTNSTYYEPINAHLDIKGINQPNSLSGISCTSQEKLMMISLLSDEEEFDSDCNKISGPRLENINNNTSSLTSQLECSTNIENNSTSAQKESNEEGNELNEINQNKTLEKSCKAQGRRSDEFGKQNVKKRKTDSDCNKVSGPCLDNVSNNTASLSFREECSRKTGNNSVSAENECRKKTNELDAVNQNKIVEKSGKIHGSDEFGKQNVKKRKGGEKDTPSQPREFDFCGVFYKVKLTNLHPRMNYSHIASIMRKAELDYVDILFVNTGGYKSFAEISFTNSTAREKAVSLDKTFSHLGMKIKIKAI